MNKYFVLILISFGLTSCNARDANYYRSHPKELQKVMKACPDKQPRGLSCQQAQQIAVELNGLAYQLQSNPQGFGSKILTLQQTIANQETELKKTGNNQELKAALKKNKQDLADYLVIVKWLESPES